MPGVRLYRRPNDATFVLNIVLALATGFLADRLRAGPIRARRVASWIGGAVGLTLVVWAFYFAWHAYVDGQPRKILQSNYKFRGVHVKPSERRIVFRFEPFSWLATRERFSQAR